MAGEWEKEVRERLRIAENKKKYARLMFENDRDAIYITIRDEGEGFSWQNYIDFDPRRMTDPHGRGIAMARNMSFSHLEYRDDGREVICAISMPKELSAGSTES